MLNKYTYRSIATLPFRFNQSINQSMQTSTRGYLSFVLPREIKKGLSNWKAPFKKDLFNCLVN
ncbi:MAG: hypothetical protein ACJAU0_001777 [Flavobacteriales bacterium]|jgi:hypothetical protein